MFFFLLVLSFGGSFLHAQERPFENPESAPDATTPVLIRGMEATGVVDVGYRSVAGFNGSQDYYRSVVNLGNGPRLLFANMDFQSPLGTKKYFDKLHFDASAWGGDPYNTMRVYTKGWSSHSISITGTWITIITSHFCQPSAARGSPGGPTFVATAIRTMDFDLILRPGRKSLHFLPTQIFWFWSGNRNLYGAGNEFPVNNQVSNSKLLSRWV
jgi:hypothetical protein